MRKSALFIVTAFVVVFAGPKSYSSNGDGTYPLDLVNNYYSDNSYSSAIGWDERDCYAFMSGGSTIHSPVG